MSESSSLPSPPDSTPASRAPASGAPSSDHVSPPDPTRSSRSIRSALKLIREALGGGHHDYTTGPLGRAITLLAIPTVLEMALESVFAICDVFFVSRLGDAAVATVGLTESMLTLIYALAVGFAMATTALVSRRIGEKNPQGATRAAKQAVLLGVIVGAVTGIPCAVFAGDLLWLMGAGPEVIETGSGYTTILLGTNVVIMLLFLNNAVFRGAGDAALAMRALWLANGINLVLDPCLIFGLGPFPELGVTGAAIATTIGRGSGVLYQLWMLRRARCRIVLRPPLLRLEPAIMRELLRLSVGGVTQFLIATASWVALMKLVARHGDAAVAGYTIAIRIVVFALLPSWGLSNAAATLVGQNLGAGRPERAERAVWLTGWFNTVFLAFVTILFVAFDHSLVTFFSETTDTVLHGANALRIISYGYVFYAWGMVVTQAFNGAGDTMTPTRINLVCFWLLQIPLAWTLAEGLAGGPPGVFWAVAIAEAILAVVAIMIFRLGRWKETRLAPDTEPAEG